MSDAGRSDALVTRTWIAMLAAAPAAIVLAPLLWRLDTPLLGWTYGKSYQPFELLGFTMTAALAIAALRLRGSALRDALPAIGLIAAAFYFSGSIVEYSARSFDYYCYETAAALFNEGRNPYSPERGTVYLYPPLFAIAMAKAQSAAIWLAGMSPAPVPADRAGDILFFGFQSLQLLAGICLYPLLYLLARRAGAGALMSAGISLALVLIDTPVTRTLKHNQVNLLVLDLALLTCLFPQRALIAGLLLAAGTHIKLYPALLILPLWALGYRRVVMWWALGMLAPLAAAPVRELWPLYAEATRRPPSWSFRDNSVLGFMFNATRLVAAESAALIAARAAGALWAISVLVVMLRRLRSSLHRPLYAAGAEWLAVAVLISPIAWEHHYVLALPLVAVQLARPGGASWPAVIASALILLPPTFDVFPLSYHRLAALLWLLIIHWRTDGRPQ